MPPSIESIYYLPDFVIPVSWMSILFSSSRSWETSDFFHPLSFSSSLFPLFPPTSRIPFFEKERSDNNGGRRLSLRHYSRRASKDNRLDSQSLLKLPRVRNRGNSFLVENNTNCCCHLEALNLVNVIKRRKRHPLLLSSVVPIPLKIGLLGSDARRAIRSFEKPSQCAVLERRP